jgi:hypothetical protein
MRKFLFLAALFLAALFLVALLVTASPAPAQNPPKGFSGSFVSLNGDTVTLQDKDGKTFTVEMTPGWTVSANRAGSPADIKPGDFVATTNVPLDETTGKSTELRILEPGYRPEQGTHAVSPTNPNRMTHGTVKSIAKVTDGVELEIAYPAGSRIILVAAAVPVTISDPLDKTILKPGQIVGGVTRPGPDGIQRASRLQLQNK